MARIVRGATSEGCPTFYLTGLTTYDSSYTHYVEWSYKKNNGEWVFFERTEDSGNSTKTMLVTLWTKLAGSYQVEADYQVFDGDGNYVKDQLLTTSFTIGGGGGSDDDDDETPKVYIYATKSGKSGWYPATPYIYVNGKWNKATPYIYNGGWK